MNNLIDIEWKILTMLNTLKSPDSVFNEVQDVFAMDNQTFPYVWFELVSEELLKKSVNENQISWVFEIYMFQEINEKEGISRKDAKSTVQKWTKQISDLFQKNETFDWEITQSWLTNIVYNAFADEKWIIYYSKITLEVEFYQNITIL